MSKKLKTRTKKVKSAKISKSKLDWLNKNMGSWDDLRDEILSDSETAVEYIKYSMNDRKQFISALKDVAEAQGMAKVAKKSGIPRESLYRMLGKSGNPTYENLMLLLKGLGLQPSVELLSQRRKAAKKAARKKLKKAS